MLFNFISTKIISHTKPNLNFQSRFLSSSSPFTTNSPNQHSFTVDYLINSCGFSPQSAISVSKQVDLSKSPNTADSVLTFLTNHNFTKTQISKLISKRPKILLHDPESTLFPAFRTLNSIGLSTTDLTSIVSNRPKVIFSKSLQDRASQCVKFLKSILHSDDEVIKAIKRYPVALTYDPRDFPSANVKILREIGVTEPNIVAMLAFHPVTFFTPADRFRKVVEDVMKMGIDPSKVKFVWAVKAVKSISKSAWDNKIKLYKKFGWSEDEIITAFEKHPWCMIASADKINRIMDFLVNTMGWESSYIAKWPIVISFSFEKRIVPRCLVYQHLAEKGMIEGEFSFTKWLMYSESKFLKWVVKEYEEESEGLVELYQKHLEDVKGNVKKLSLDVVSGNVKI